MKCVSYTRTLPWKNHQGELTIAEQNQRIAAYLAEHKELDLQKMLIGGFVIFMIPQVVGSVIVLLELAAVMLRQAWYI